MEPVIRNHEGVSNPVLGPDDGVPNYVMLYAEHEPGGSSPHHSHAWEHEAFIVEGAGTLSCDGKSYPIRKGDCVLVPPNTEHQFINTGSEPLIRVTINPLSSVQGG